MLFVVVVVVGGGGGGGDGVAELEHRVRYFALSGKETRVTCYVLFLVFLFVLV